MSKTPTEKSVHVQYVAILREQRGQSEETVQTSAATAKDLYAQLRKQHAFSMPVASLRVAVNDGFADWDTKLKSGDRVVFLPPVSGG